MLRRQYWLRSSLLDRPVSAAVSLDARTLEEEHTPQFLGGRAIELAGRLAVQQPAGSRHRAAEAVRSRCIDQVAQQVQVGPVDFVVDGEVEVRLDKRKAVLRPNVRWAKSTPTLTKK